MSLRPRLCVLFATALTVGVAMPSFADPVDGVDAGQTVCDVYLDLVQNGGCSSSTSPAARPAGQGRQTVRGEIASPLGSAVTVVGAAPVTTRAQPANGLASWTFEVAARTVGGRFVLDVGSQANLDIVFYDGGRGVNHTAPRPTGTFYTAGVDGEQGMVPKGSVTAVVTIAEGNTARFAYRADPRPAPRRAR